MKNIQITSAGIRKALKKYNSSQSIAEYIWNGFDAQATQVDISFTSTDLGGISELKIQDNGNGISDPTRFQPFFESDKEIDPNAARTSSTVHGKNGVGRLTFFTFASLARWETVFEQEGNKYKYSIEVDAFTLDRYTASNSTETLESVGTIVFFNEIYTLTADEFNTDIKEFLCRELGWFLELNLSKNFRISINGVELDYKTTLVAEQELIEQRIEKFLFKIKFICWQ